MRLSVKKTTIWFFLITLSIAFIVGNRGDTRDTIVYYWVFKYINILDLLNPAKFYIFTGMEIGFGWYCYLISFITNSHIVLFTTFSFLTFYIIYLVSYKIDANHIFVLLLYLSSGYFLSQQFMQIRQGFASPLALYALTIFVDKEDKFYVRFLLITLLAFSFHQVSLPIVCIGVLLSFLLRIKISLIKFKWLSIVILVVFIFIAKFALADFLVNVSSRIETYSNSAEYSGDIGVFRLPNIKAFLTFLFILFFMNKDLYKNKLFAIFFLLFTIGVAFRIGFSEFAILSGRFATAFSFSEIFLLPFIFYRFKNFKTTLFILFVTLQAIATYMFQAPYVINDYFRPLAL
nr:EpsG family protein [uncultured Capnocytophaga sp.]